MVFLKTLHTCKLVVVLDDMPYYEIHMLKHKKTKKRDSVFKEGYRYTVFCVYRVSHSAFLKCTKHFFKTAFFAAVSIVVNLSPYQTFIKTECHPISLTLKG